MTLTHVATTTPDVSAPNAGTSDDVTWVGVGAKRLAVLVGAMKYNTIAFAAVSGFTFLGDRAGGNPAENAAQNLADLGTTRIGVWTKEMTGAETGFFNVAGSSTPNALRCALSVYECTSQSFSVEIMTADDATHGMGQSHVYGTWATPVQPGDVILAAFAYDTDNNAVRTPSLIQTGITFGALTDRANSRSTTGNDLAVYSVEAVVSSGTNGNAPTAAYTTASNMRCGPGAIIRIREVTSGPPPSGEASFDVSLTLAGTGRKKASGATAVGAAFAVSASGHKVARGAVAVTAALVPASNAGQKRSAGSADMAISVEMQTFDIVAPEVGPLLAQPTHTSTVYNLVGEADEWSGERTEEPGIVDVPCSIIEQERVVRKPQTGIPTVARDAIGRFPDRTPIGKYARVVDSEGRFWSVVSTRQKRNPVWVGDMVVELLRIDQAST